MAFERLSRVLPGTIRHAGIEKQVTTVQVVTEAAHILKQLWGPEKAAYLQVLSFSEGVLRIKALAPSAQQEAKMQAVEWQNAINHRLGGKKIHQLLIVT
jgi:hypothetical protein